MKTPRTRALGAPIEYAGARMLDWPVEWGAVVSTCMLDWPEEWGAVVSTCMLDWPVAPGR